MTRSSEIHDACMEIRTILATADTTSEKGVADMLRDARKQLERIEHDITVTDTKTCKYGKSKAALRRFFRIQNKHGDDVWINLFRISYVIEKEVTMSDGTVFPITRDEADRLVEIIDCSDFYENDDRKGDCK